MDEHDKLVVKILNEEDNLVSFHKNQIESITKLSNEVKVYIIIGTNNIARY